LGAISEAGDIDISMSHKPFLHTRKESERQGCDVVNGRVASRTEHYLAYLSNIMDVLYKNNLKRHYPVMDSALIHIPIAVRAIIEESGYQTFVFRHYIHHFSILSSNFGQR
jgi:hypothetical protein